MTKSAYDPIVETETPRGCPFCGSHSQFMRVIETGKYALHTSRAYKRVKCRICGAQGPESTRPIERWNQRSKLC